MSCSRRRAHNDQKDPFKKNVSRRDVKVYHAYLFVNEDYLHKKCVYDYFNLVIKNLPLKQLFPYLKLCRLASSQDKIMMLLRWIKRRIL